MSERKEAANLAFAAVEEDLREISHWLYQNPETAYQEHHSSRRLVQYLETKGIDVIYPAHGLDTAFEATLGTTGPRVVICAEYDALPVVGHACGHNIIATAALGAFLAVAEMVQDLGARVTLLGTPAEEGGGGKIALIEAGAFEDASASMMIHPYTTDLLDKSFQARRSFTVEFFGTDSHAASTPHLGVNALDAFVQAYMNVATLRQHYLPGDRTHCIINHGGDASNIIPSHTVSTWGVRAETGERLDELVGKVKACWEAAAIATGCVLTVSPLGLPYVDVDHNLVMKMLFQANSTVLGRDMPEEELPGGGSTDMGNVSRVVPSIHPMVAIEAGGAVNHQKGFADATVSPSGEKAIRDGALAMAHTIIDMAEQDVWDRL